MKYAWLLFFAVGSVHAAAFDPAVSQVCTKLLTCGHFEGAGGPLGQKTVFTEKIEITATGDLTAKVVLELWAEDAQGEPETYDLEFQFKEDGQFTATSGKGLYASGICKDGRCTYGMIPFESAGHKIGNAGIFRFTPGRLERFMFVIDEGGTYQQLTDLKAK